MSEEEPLKVILLGNGGVGKSNLIARFHNNDFCEDFESTVGVEFVTKRITVDGVPVKLQIWDTAGQERYASMMKTYYRKAKGSLLVYDVTSRPSFSGLEAWRKHLEANADPLCVSVVTGNKSDIASQEVTEQEGRAYASERGMSFLPTSAKTGDNVEKAFVMLARNILQAGNGVPSAQGAKSHRLHGAPHPQASQDCC
ncbi:unnamed protein product [Pylaiella littoralis]